MKNTCSILALTALGCQSVEAAPSMSKQPPAAAPELVMEVPSDEAERLRAQGPSGLRKALAKYAGLKDDEKSAYERVVDEVAGQRYASYSRLYWYTDLDSAKQAARRSNKAILSLRMLGKLTEERSCANSRFFRSVLYANPRVSSYLKKSFVLHWSSEREVPKITIDFGDGRRIENTITGNSVHYVLDKNGRPVDAIPGLYSPKAFIAALEPARKFAGEVTRSKDRNTALRQYHQRQLSEESKRFAKLPQAQRAALGPLRLRQTTSQRAMAAQAQTFSKAFVEVPILFDPRAEQIQTASTQFSLPQLLGPNQIEPIDVSTGLIARLTRLPKIPLPAQALFMPGTRPTLAGSLPRSVAADTLLNTHALRPMIHRIFVEGTVTNQLFGGWRNFDELNKTIYADVFLTPRTDPWLGLHSASTFTALPSQGLVVPQTR